MNDITHHHDDNGTGNGQFNYSHDACPTCQDWLIVARVRRGGRMWGSHLLWMLRFWLPWMSVPMGWSGRAGELFGRWFHSHQNDYAISKEHTILFTSFWSEELSVDYGKRYSAGTPWLFFERGSIPFEKKMQTKSTLVWNQLLNALNLFVDRFFTNIIHFISFLLHIIMYVYWFNFF